MLDELTIANTSCPNVWIGDDISQCARSYYIGLYLPALLILISLLSLSYQTLLKWSRGHVSEPHAPLLADSSPSYGAVDPAQHAPITSDSIMAASQSKVIDLSHVTESVFTVDVPRHKRLRNFIELACVLAILFCACSSYSNLTDRTPSALAAAHGSVSVWSYLFLLYLVRLVLPRSESLRRLWYHSTSIIFFLYLGALLCWRSALLGHSDSYFFGLFYWYFAFHSLLLLSVTTSRITNSNTTIEHKKGTAPAPDTTSSILSRATYTFVDSLIFGSVKKSIDLDTVPDVRPSDHSVYVANGFRRLGSYSSLTWALISFFRKEISLAFFWAFLSSLTDIVPIFLMKAILDYIENPSDTRASMSWLYAIGLGVSQICSSAFSGQALYIGRILCIRIRAVLVSEIYSKALRRRVYTSSSDDDDEESSEGISAKGKDTEQDDDEEDSSNLSGSAQQGKIINLMSVDAYKVSEICAYLHFFVQAAVTLVVSLTMLYMLLGWSFLGGAAVVVLLFPSSYICSKLFSKAQTHLMSKTDDRIHVTNEVMQSIRIIKYFGWEELFAGEVNKAREKELKALLRRYIVWTFSALNYYGAPPIITMATFSAYTFWAGNHLTVPVAFTAITLFNLLRRPLDEIADMLISAIQSKVSINRISDFLAEEDTQKYVQVNAVPRKIDSPLIGFESATIGWSSSESSSDFKLRDISINFQEGQLTVITGPTGSGKTSLLMALLGEMNVYSGAVYLPGIGSREDFVPDPETKLINSVAYCAQQAWLFNDTIKNNILFSAPFDEDRYSKVVEACALQRDFDILDFGDETLVGEKGITLSGGQKQRISLARAIYSNAKHLLLDDCLSAVDSHTSLWIYEEALLGPLMSNRTCILVSHNVALTIRGASHVIVMRNGRVVGQGSPAEVSEKGLLGDDELIRDSVAQSSLVSRSQSTVNVMERNDDIVSNAITDRLAEQGMLEENVKPFDADTKKPVKIQPSNEETYAEGALSWEVYSVYLKALGPWYFWLLVAISFGSLQLMQVGQSYWIRAWARGVPYDTELMPAVHVATSPFSSSSAWSLRMPFNYLGLLRGSVATASIMNTAEQGHSNLYYLVGYAILTVAFNIFTILREMIVFYGSLTASRRVFNRLLNAMLYAKLRFFDSTPLGRILNRFSKDIETIDQELAAISIYFFQMIISAITVIILVSVITPLFLIAAVFITLLYFVIGYLYLSASRALKRLDSVTKSPIFQNFGETLSGVATIRAYGDERRFLKKNFDMLDTNHRPFIYLWIANRWLSLRADITGALVSFFSAFFVFMAGDKIDSGLAGLSISYALTFNESLLWVVRMYSALEIDMNSVERINEYIKVEQEAPPVIEDKRPPVGWPAHGHILVQDLTLRYAPSLPTVINGVSFEVMPRAKVGIVGRTGAGKSTIISAFFRFLEAEKGQILIDGLDISEIGLRDLRHALTIIPQDPTLFAGTIRFNLDPFKAYSDEQIYEALRRVQLISKNYEQGRQENRANANSGSENVNVFYDLEYSVEEGGSNLSHGQRQLMCLARSLLRMPKLILLDEATASIDYDTDARIQRTIREEFGQSTLLTIAHRLKSIIDYDMILVMDAGRAVEYDVPYNLLQRKDSIFRNMCENSGEFATLEKMAEQAYKCRDQSKIAPSL
ncbi:hypothetical protein CANCADRAFT_30494 [Tortispora caseinolytica NRRL Y-17796]|uniref:ATP-dependent bile acid permease n=1 Tax=Tortispora caseinolytica NRRL Y-17796 TaxID=767744 RepID=A0A1E4TKL2_9ASCO|nr:hypothetical protein CANCADRAFT_30494 [Tortispora caseinolytica NRRL Y-17796]